MNFPVSTSSPKSTFLSQILMFCLTTVVFPLWAIEAPHNVTATTASGSQSVELAWSSVSDATGYNIYRDNTYLTTVNSSVTAYTDNSVGSAYYVTAFNVDVNPVDYSDSADSARVSPSSGGSGQPSSGYVFSRTDITEYRWISNTNDGQKGSVWIDEACAGKLGPATSFGDWSDLVALAPAFDGIANPCNDATGNPPETEPPSTDGYVFSRTDIGEYRWIAQDDNGQWASVWIDAQCAAKLGDATEFGDWTDLVNRAPGFDALDNPCSSDPSEGEGTPSLEEGYVFSRTDIDEFRWIAADNQGQVANVWIDQACAETLGPVRASGNWSELVALAPGFDQLPDPCAGSVTPPESKHSVISVDRHVDLVKYLFDIQTGRKFGQAILDLPGYSNPDYEDHKAANGPLVGEGHGRIENVVCENGGTGQFTAFYQGYRQRIYGWDFDFNNCQDGANVLQGKIQRRDDCNQYVYGEGITITGQSAVTDYKGDTVYVGCGYRSGGPYQWYEFILDHYSVDTESSKVVLSDADFKFSNASEFARSMVGQYTIASPETDNQSLNVVASLSRTRMVIISAETRWGDTGNYFVEGSMEITASNGDFIKLDADNGDLDTVTVTISSVGVTETFVQPWLLWNDHLNFGRDFWVDQ